MTHFIRHWQSFLRKCRKCPLHYGQNANQIKSNRTRGERWRTQSVTRNAYNISVVKHQRKRHTSEGEIMKMKSVVNGRSKRKTYIRNYKGGRIYRNNCFKFSRTTNYQWMTIFYQRNTLDNLYYYNKARKFSRAEENYKEMLPHAIWLAAYFFVYI